MNPFVSGSIFFGQKSSAAKLPKPKPGCCPKGADCTFAHGAHELQISAVVTTVTTVTEMDRNGNDEWKQRVVWICMNMYEYVWICMNWRWTMKFDSVGCPKNQEWASILWPFCHRTKINDDDKMEVFLGPLFSDNHNPTFSRFLNTNFPKQRTYLTYRTNLSWNLSCLLLGFEPSIVPF